MHRSNRHHVTTILKRTCSHPSNRSRRLRAMGTAIGRQVEKRVVGRPPDEPFDGLRLHCYPDSQSASNVISFTPRYNPAETGFGHRLPASG